MGRLLEFLFSLRSISGAELARAHVSFALGPPWLGLIVLLALGAALLGYLSYRRQSATRGQRVVLGLLRAALLLLVIMLLAQPQITVDHELRTPAVVAVWLDDSRSMSLADPYTGQPAMVDLVAQVTRREKPQNAPRADRYQLGLDALTGPRGAWLKQIAAQQDVALFRGGPAPVLVGISHKPADLTALLEQLRAQAPVPTSDATDVPTIVAGMLRDLQGQPISAAVLLTDGRSTEGTPLAVATNPAEQARVPVFAVPLGQQTEPLNVQVARLEMEENVFARDPVLVKVPLHVAGVAQASDVVVTLTDKDTGKLLAERTLRVEPGTSDPIAELIFKPEDVAPGQSRRINLVAAAQPLADELTLADNQTQGTLTVMDARMRVLLIDGSPRWEFRYLRNELIREKTVDVSTLLLSADDDFAQEGNTPITRFPDTADELRRYDVLLIGDVQPQYFSPQQMKLIVDFVKTDGGGIGWIAGPRYTPDAYRGTALEVLLPIIPDDANAPTLAAAENAPFDPVLTAAGKASTLFRFFDDPAENVRQMADNPPLYWYKPVVGLKPAAEVLAVHPTRSLGGAPAPLIVTSQFGAGRTFFSAIADTWRWRRYKGEPLYQSYWLQVCRLLYRDKAMGQSKRFELAADSRVVEVGQPIRLTAKVRDAALVNALPGQIRIDVTDEAGRPLDPITMTRSSSEADSYSGLATAGRVGTLTLTVAPGVLPIDVPAVRVQVQPPQREFASTTADYAALETIAARTEGRIVALPDVGQLGTLVSDKSQLTLLSRSEALWNKPIVLFIAIALLTIEWLVRKRAGLI